MAPGDARECPGHGQPLVAVSHDLQSGHLHDFAGLLPCTAERPECSGLGSVRLSGAAPADAGAPVRDRPAPCPVASRSISSGCPKRRPALGFETIARGTAVFETFRRVYGADIPAHLDGRVHRRGAIAATWASGRISSGRPSLRIPVGFRCRSRPTRSPFWGRLTGFNLAKPCAQTGCSAVGGSCSGS